jgi:nicotinamidase-related amidase
VCGLAFDFCVGNTALDAKKYGVEVKVIKEATRSVMEKTELTM